MPDYPPLPRAARVQGIQTVKVLLSEEATVKTIESSLKDTAGLIDATKQEFRDSVAKALKNSLFSMACGGKTITLVFHYEFRENNNKSLFAFEPPNHFWVRAGPDYVMPVGSVK